MLVSRFMRALYAILKRMRGKKTKKLKRKDSFEVKDHRIDKIEITQ